MNSHQKRKERRKKEREAEKFGFEVRHNPTIKGEYNLNKQVENIFNIPEDATPIKPDWHPKIHFVCRPWYERLWQNICCYFGDFHCRFCFNHHEERCCNCENEMPFNFTDFNYHQKRRAR